ncbi:MAG TPA: AAA family ATPase [Ktedonobacteraceae bacterium]|jgi:DNA-binding SARP family transcriptional activator
MQQIVCQFLGPPEILYQGQLIRIPRRRSRALLYYLLSTQSPQPRERLLTLLCGDVDEESARKTFKTLLAEVRSLLRSFDPGLDWILNDGSQLRLNPRAPLWLDTEIFEKMAAGASRNLNQAVNLYRGSFLDGFFLKDAPDFDAWVRSARDHFQRLYIKTLRQLAEVYESERQFEQAISCIQLLLSADPLLEEAYAHLMRLCWITGDRIEALRQYEQLCAVLARELAIRPTAATQELYERIARQGVVSAYPAPTGAGQVERSAPQPARGVAGSTPGMHLPFVGREQALQWVHCQLTAAANPPALLLIQGAPGIGKTRLLQEIHAQLDASWLVLQGSCQEVEQVHSYHAIVAALRQGLAGEDLGALHLPAVWLGQLARLLPDYIQFAACTPEYGPTESLILADALVALLNSMVRPQHPILLMLDDLHWADSATLAVLGHLAAHLRRGSVFLLGTYCKALAPQHLEPLRRSASRQDTLAELVLPALSADEMRRLTSCVLTRTHLASLAAEEQEALLAWCCQRSEGNPLFASVWLSLILKQPGAPHHLSTFPIPEPLAALVRQQLARVSHEAFALLSAAAVQGPLFDLQAAAHLLHLPAATLISAHEELCQRALIVEQTPAGQGTYAFAHRVVRDVLLASGGARHLPHLRQSGQEN